MHTTLSESTVWSALCVQNVLKALLHSNLFRCFGRINIQSSPVYRSGQNNAHFPPTYRL